MGIYFVLDATTVHIFQECAEVRKMHENAHNLATGEKMFKMFYSLPVRAK